MSATATSRPTLWDVFRNINFVKFWVGQFVSYLGDRISQMAMIAVLSMGATAAVGADHANMITFWATLPYVLVSPFAGVLIDRYDRRKLMILSDILRGAVVFALPFAVSPDTHPWIIYAVVGFIGAATAVFAPAKSAFIPEIVEREHLLRANSVTSAMGTLTVLIGTVVGGILVARLSYQPSLIIDSATYFFSAMMLIWIRMPSVERLVVDARSRELKREGGYFSNIKRGFLYLTRHRLAGMCVLLDSWFFLIGGLLFTCITKIVYLRLAQNDGGPGGSEPMEAQSIRLLGYACGILGLGLAVGGILTGKYAGHLRLRWLFATCYVIAACFIAGLALPVNAGPVYLMLFVIGYVAGGVVVCIETTLQKSVPDEMRGRVFSLNGLLLNTVLLVSIAVGASILRNQWLSINAMLLATSILALVGAVGAFVGIPAGAKIAAMRVSDARSTYTGG
jgi:MFS family permease